MGLSLQSLIYFLLFYNDFDAFVPDPFEFSVYPIIVSEKKLCFRARESSYICCGDSLLGIEFPPHHEALFTCLELPQGIHDGMQSSYFGIHVSLRFYVAVLEESDTDRPFYNYFRFALPDDSPFYDEISLTEDVGSVDSAIAEKGTPATYLESLLNITFYDKISRKIDIARMVINYKNLSLLNLQNPVRGGIDSILPGFQVLTSYQELNWFGGIGDLFPPDIPSKHAGLGGNQSGYKISLLYDGERRKGSVIHPFFAVDGQRFLLLEPFLQDIVGGHLRGRGSSPGYYYVQYLFPVDIAGNESIGNAFPVDPVHHPQGM